MTAIVMSGTKKLRILFDANPLAQSSKSGVGYYTYRLINSLAQEYPLQLELIGHYYDFLGRKGALDLPTAPNIHYRTTRLIPGKVFNLLQRRFGLTIPLELLARCRGDVLFFANFTLLPSLFRRPRVVTIHDLYFTEHPEHIQAKNLVFMNRFVPAAIRGADLILAVSEFTKQEIIKKYDIPDERIIVTHIPPQPGTKQDTKTSQALITGLGIPGKYILFVGTLEPRKNLTTLVKAYEALDPALRDKYSLVLAGGKGWNDDELQSTIAAAQAQGLAVITPGYISDEQKAALYAEASIVAVPSWYEGFGMQLLEAMAEDVPVLASNIPVFHEVADDAALYVKPDDVADVSHGLAQLLNDTTLRQQLVKAGQARLKTFDWKLIAQEVQAALAALVKK